MNAKLKTNDLEAFWMPFTANRQFKKAPRLFVGRQGHALRHATTAATCSTARRASGASTPATAGRRSSRRSASRPATLDFAGTFQMGHAMAFEAAARSSSTSRPTGFDHVFFTNSGSESVDTALKMALAYHRAKGNGHARCASSAASAAITASTSAAPRSAASPTTARCSARSSPASITCRHTHDLARNAFSRGEPEHGAELADDLERLVALHDASTIAAVHRRAGRLLDRRADPAEGLSRSASPRSAPSTTSCSSSTR